MPRRRLFRSLDVPSVKAAPTGRQTVDLRGTTSPASDLERKEILLSGYYSALGGGQGIAGMAGRPWTFDRSIKEGYSRVVWVYKAVETIANNQSRLPVRAFIGDPDEYNVIDDHPCALLLNGTNCSQLNESGKVYRKRLSQQILLSPRGAFTEVVLSRAGTPLSYTLLPPNRTRIVPAKDGSIDHYEVDPARPGDKVKTRDPDQVRWTREPHPSDPYAGMTPLEAAGLSVEMDHFARLFNRSFLANDGRPGMVVGIKPTDEDSGELDERESERMERKFGGGLLDAGRTVVVDGTVSAVDMGGTPRDGSWMSVREAGKDEILVAYGVPESQIGHAANSKFLNGQVEGEAYWLLTQLPHNDTVDDTWAPDSNDFEVSVGFDVRKVDALSRVARESRKEWREEVTGGFRSRVAYQRRADFRPDEIIDVPGTRSLWVAGGVPIAPTPDDQVRVEKLEPVGTATQNAPTTAGAAGPPTGQPGIGADAPYQTDPASMTPGYKSHPAPRERKLQAVGDRDGGDDEEDDRAQTVAEGTLETLLTAVVRRLAEITVARLQGPKARRGTRHWTPAAGEPASTKALNPAAVVDPEQWRAQVEQIAVQVLNPLGRQTAAKLNRQLGDQAPPPEPAEGPQPPAVNAPQDDAHPVRDAAILAAVRWLAQAGQNKADELQQVIAKAEATDHARVLAGGVEQGVAPIVEAIHAWAHGPTPEFGSLPEDSGLVAWARARAFAAVTAVVEGVRSGILSRLGERVQRTWITKRDDRVRDAHRLAEGQTVTGDDPFTVGGEHLRFPGDPTGSPGNVINCRCRQKWRLLTKPQPLEGKLDPEVEAAQWLAAVEAKAVPFDPHKHPRGAHGRFTHGLEDIMKAAAHRNPRTVIADTLGRTTSSESPPVPPAPPLTPVKPGKAYRQRVAEALEALPDRPGAIGVQVETPEDNSETQRLDPKIKMHRERAAKWQAAIDSGIDPNTGKPMHPTDETFDNEDGAYTASLAGAARYRDQAQQTADDLTRKRGEFVEWFRNEYGEERRGTEVASDGGPLPDLERHLSAVITAGKSIEGEARRRAKARAKAASIDDAALQARIDAARAAADEWTEAWEPVRRAREEQWLRDTYGIDGRTGLESMPDREQAMRIKADLFPRDFMTEDEADEQLRVFEVVTDLLKERMDAQRQRKALERDSLLEVLSELRPMGGEVRVKFSAPEKRADKIWVGNKIDPAGDGTPYEIVRVDASLWFRGEIGRRFVIRDPAGVETTTGFYRDPDTIPMWVDPDVGVTPDDQVRAVAVRWGERFYPADWIRASNDRGVVTMIEGEHGNIYVDRGYYRDDPQDGSGSLALSSRGGSPLPGGNQQTDPVVIHELAHRMEHSLPDITALEWAFQWQRTTDSPGSVKRTRHAILNQLHPLPGYGGGEYGRPDKYPNMYSGKEYGGGPSNPWEILSTTMESLFAGSDYADPQMRAFALGVLATIGRPAAESPAAAASASAPA